MTKKEFNIQRALGTLPLWKRLELGDIEFVDIPIHSHNVKCISIPGVINGLPRYYYRKDMPIDKKRTMRRLIEDCKKGGWRDD
ncbi:hypothetical protein LCGC14_1039490 [marine sediment metagenome]|uniref:Uncharacterized protein n=1 Tax=marine sediment metagenome TaxID=412755 RepID=A0A0F9QAE9_9ZZZZ